MPLKSDETMIPIKKSVRDELKDIGKKGETYSDIIKRLVDFYVENK